MEKWQKEHLTKHLPQLIEETYLNVNLSTILSRERFLSTNDVDQLETRFRSEGKFAQTSLLYQIVMTRSNGYDALAGGLYDTKQTGAYKIFESGYKAHGVSNPIQTNRISRAADVNNSTNWSDLSDNLQRDIFGRIITFMGSQIPLNRIIDKLAPGMMTQCFPGCIISDILNYKYCIEIKSNIPEQLNYYVTRRLQPRKQLDSKLFEKDGKDVFVFRGIEWNKLTEIPKGRRRSTDISTNQTDCLNVRYIMLEYEEDFTKICKLGAGKNQPVHLLEYTQEAVYWVRSNGNVSGIQGFVVETNETVSEGNFLLKCLTSPAVCISATPGMGKTVLLANLGRELLSNEPESVVLYIVLRDFVRKLDTEQNFNNELICDVLAKEGSDTKVGQEILKNCLLSENVQCNLLFDGYDEVLSRQLETTRGLLEAVRNLKNVRMFVTTRLHMREELEKLLQVLGYNIRAFQKYDQVEFLQKFWEEKGGCKNEKMKEFADTCLAKLKERPTDVGSGRDFAGIPLKCRLLAEVHCENALKYSNPDSKAAIQDFGINISVTSTFELYNRLIDIRFKDNEPMLQHHMHLAIEQLFPDWIKKLKLKPGNYSIEQICKVGVLEKKCMNDMLRFIHQTVAEFLVAKFVIEEANKKVAWYWRFFSDPNKINEGFWKFLLTEILSPVKNTESIMENHGFGYSEQIESARCKHQDIVYFINEFLKHNDAVQVHIPQQMNYYCDTNHFHQQLSAAVCHDFEKFARILVDFNIRDEKAPLHPISPNNLLLLCAKHANKKVFEQICRLCPNQNFQAFKFQRFQNPDFMITPLHIAIHFGKYKLVEHLINKCGYGELLTPTQLPYLVHLCVFKNGLDRAVISKKMEIIKLLCGRNREYIDERMADGTTPLLQLQVHLNLIHLLVELGADVNSLNNANESLLHIVLKSPTSEKVEEYDSLISKVAEANYIHFNKKANGRTPFHLAVSRLDVDNRTIEYFANNQGNVNALDDNNDSVLFAAIRGGRNTRLLTKLVEMRADINHQNSAGETVLHIGAKHGNVEAAQLFSDSDVNAADNQMNTPLHCAVSNTSPAYEHIQLLLLERGSNVNATNQNGHIPLLHGIVHGRGMNMHVIREMEKCRLEVSCGVASLALKHHIVERSIKARGKDWVEVADYLKLEKGAFITGNQGQSPWELEEVLENLTRIEEAIEWNHTLTKELRRRGLLTEKDDSVLSNQVTAQLKVQAFLSHLKPIPGSYEHMLTSLVAAKQVTASQLLRQCFQSHALGSSRFVSPPPGVNEFLEDMNLRVLILTSTQVDVAVERIRDTLGHQLHVVRELEQLKRKHAEVSLILVAVCYSGHQGSQYLDEISEHEWRKVIIIVPERIITKLPAHVTEAEDEIKWTDLSDSFIKKLSSVLFGDIDVSKYIEYFKGLTNVEIFALIRIVENPGDVLVFKGIAFEELHVLAKCGNKVGVSGEQVEKLDAEYIALEDDKHVEEILEKTSKNVHVLDFKDNGGFVLVRSRGKVVNICQCLEVNADEFVEANEYFNSNERMVLVQGEFVLWRLFFEELKNERDSNGNEATLFAYLGENDLRLDKFSAFCDGKYKPGEILNDFIRLIFGNFFVGVIESVCQCNMCNIVLGLHCTTCAYDLDLLKRVIDKVCNESNRIRFWIIVVRDIFRLERMFGIVGHELREVSRAELVQSIVEKWSEHESHGRDLEQQATTYLEKYESQILDKFPMTSVSVCLVCRFVGVNVLLPASPVGNSSFYSYLIAGCFGKRECVDLESGVAGMCEQMLDDYIKLVAGHYNNLEESVNIVLMKFAVWSLFPGWSDLFIDMEGIGGPYGGIKGVFLNVKMASYIIARLLVDSEYSNYLKRDRLVEFVRQVLSSSFCPVFDNFSICYFLNSILGKHTDGYFNGIVAQVLNGWGSVKQCVMACVVANCLNLLKALVIVGGDDVDGLVGKRVLGLASVFGDVGTLAFIFDMYRRRGGVELGEMTVDFDKKFWQLLKLAVMRGDHSVLEYLMEYQALKKLLLERSNFQCTVIHHAVRALDLKESTLDLMLKFADINDVDKNGNSVLVYAIVGKRDTRFLEMLVRKGADWRKKNTYQSTVLHRAARSGNVDALVRLGRKESQSIGMFAMRTADVWTARDHPYNDITKLTWFGNVEALRFFICKGSDVNARNKNLDTPLHDAFLEKHDKLHEVVTVLLGNGADVNAKNSEGNTPIDLAMEKHKTGLVEARTLELLKTGPYQWDLEDEVD